MRRVLALFSLTLGLALGPALLSPALLRAQIPPPPDLPGDTTPPSIEVVADPDPFSPNGDGRRDLTGIVVTTSETADVEIRVVRPKGGVVAGWELPAQPPGTVTIEWDGRSGGSAEPDGGYRLEAEATDPAGNAGLAEGSVTIDTTPPRVRLRRSPTMVDRQRRVGFRMRVRESNGPVEVNLRVLDATHEIGSASRSMAPGRGRIGWRPRYPEGGLLYPGNYRARVQATDLAGNRSRTREHRFRVERSQRGAVFNRLGRTGRRVALTFDDCHVEGAWSRILKVLRRGGVRATFFCPGRMVQAHAALARRTVRQGHTPAAHGWDHASLAGRGEAASFGRLRSDAGAWWRITGATSAPYFRPPYGAYDGAVVRAAGRSSHPRVVMWDVDPQDWTRPGAGVIAERVVSRARPGSIILLHTIDQTAEALPAILSGLRSKGLSPVTLPALFRAAGMR